MRRVLHQPDFRSTNPYQARLAKALLRRSVASDWGLPPGRWRTLQSAWKFRPKILHLHWTSPYWKHPSPPIARLAAFRFLSELRLLRKMGVQIVWTIHNLHHHESTNKALDFAINKQIFHQCAAVFVHCHRAIEDTLNAFNLRPSDKDRFVVIQHGHDLPFAGPQQQNHTIRSALHLNASTRLLLHFGQIRPYKGIDALIPAIEDSDWHLLIVGSIDDARLDSTLRRYASQSHKITYRPGYVEDHLLHQYLIAADAVALPFRNIMMSSSIVTAMSAAKPLLLTPCGCLPDYVGHAGAIYLESLNIAAIRDGLARLARSDLKRMGAANLARVRQTSWVAMAAATDAVYRTVLS